MPLVAVPRTDPTEHSRGADEYAHAGRRSPHRVIITERIVRIQVPPLVRPESVIEVPLHGVGIHSLYLRLHVRVE